MYIQTPSQLLTVSHSDASVDALSMFSFLDFFEPNRTKTVGLASMNRGPHLVAIVVRILSELGKIQVLFSTYNQLQLRTMQCIEEGWVTHSSYTFLGGKKSWKAEHQHDVYLVGFARQKIIQFSTVMNAKNLYLLDLVLQGLTHGLISWNCFKFCSQAPFLKGSNWRSTLSVRSHSQYRRTNSSRFL